MQEFYLNRVCVSLAAMILYCLSTTLSQAEGAPTLESPPVLRHDEQRLSISSVGCLVNLEKDRVLGLDEILRVAICSNPALKMSSAAVRERQANLRLANSQYWPTIDANISGSRFGKNVYYKNFPEADYALRSLTGATSISLNWVLYDGGAREANLRKAEYLMAAAQHASESVVRDIYVATSEAFYKAQYTSEAVDAAKHAVERNRIGAELSKRLLELGAGTRGDMLLAETALLQSRLDMEDSLAAEREALADLASMIGLRRDANIAITSQVKDVNANLVRVDMNYLLEEAVRRNPMVLSAIKEMNAAQAHVSAMGAERRPTIGLTANSSQSLTPPSESATEQRVRGWSIGLQVKIPIFSGFSSFQREREAVAQRDSRVAAIEKAQQEASQRLWLQKEKIDVQLSKLALTSELLTAADKAQSAAFERYKGGVGSMLELLQTQKSLTDAALKKSQTISALVTAQSELAAMIDPM